MLTDVDDTMIANLVDERYPKAPYPGVLAFYNAVKSEPLFPAVGAPEADGIARVLVTTLSAEQIRSRGRSRREASASLVTLTTPAPSVPAPEIEAECALRTTDERGARDAADAHPRPVPIASAVHGCERAEEPLPGEDPVDCLNDKAHGQEDKIGQVKHANFLAFASVYPEYRFVFVGDSGRPMR